MRAWKKFQVGTMTQRSTDVCFFMMSVDMEPKIDLTPRMDVKESAYTSLKRNINSAYTHKVFLIQLVTPPIGLEKYKQ